MIRRLAAATTVLLCSVMTVVWSPPAAARGAVPDPDGVRPGLISQTSFVEPGGRFELVLDTTDVPAGARVELAIRDRVVSRTEFALSVTGDRLRSTRFSMDRRPFSDIDGFADDTADFEIQLGSQTGQANLTREGVYPLEVRIFDADGVRTGGLMTHLVLLPEPSDDPRPIAVALVSEVALPPATAPNGERREAPAETATLARQVEVLASHPDVPMSIAARPETVAAWATAADPNSTAALVALREAVKGRQVVALPYADVDVAAMLAAGLDDELDAQLQRGEQALTDQLGVRPDTSVWLGESTLDPAATEALMSRGRESFVVSEGRVAEVNDPSGLSLTRTFGLAIPGPPPLAAKADPILGFRLLDASDPELAAHIVLAELSVLSLEAPSTSRGLVIRPPEGSAPRVETLEVLLDALSAPNALVTPVTLDQLFGQIQPLGGVETALTPQPHESLTAYGQDVRGTRQLLASYATMTGTQPTGDEPSDDLLSLAATRGLSAADRRAYVAAARGSITGKLRAVAISDARTITLTARSGSVPLTLRNDSGSPLNVLVTLDSERLDFPDGKTIALTLTEEITRVNVAVNTRSSGSFQLRVSVTSPDGELELAATRVSIRSTAVSGVGIFLSVSALLVLVLWWARDWRSGRRSRHLVERRDSDRHADPTPA